MSRVKILSAALIAMGLSACDEKIASTPATVEDPLASAGSQTVQAITQLQQRLQINPQDFAALSRLGDLYFESGQYGLAIQSYDQALAVNPDCADCLNDKGLAQFYMGNSESAVKTLEQATMVDPGYPNAWLSQGYVLFSAGRYQEAIAPLKRVSEMDSSGTLGAEADKFLAMIEERVE